MATPRDPVADRSQRRASFQQARSHQTKQSLIDAAVMLWRANGYARTTVADICRAAGVSKALFYFYFPRKEDVLFEVGALSTVAAHRAAVALLDEPYEVDDVIAVALQTLEAHMRRNPPELIIETIVEGYRRIGGADGRDVTRPEWTSDIFLEVLDRAQTDGRLPPDVDVAHLATLAQSLVSEGARRWAAGAFGDRSFAAVVGRDIAALILGFCALPQADPSGQGGAVPDIRHTPGESRSNIRK